MANVEDIDAQLHLPEDIIQQIQSFLTRKEAASTVVLSKSWYKAWLTHPVLDFDERDFPSAVQFLNFATTSMERYHELDLNIESFNLWMNAGDTYSFSRATELIVKTLEMGAIDLNLEFHPPFSFLLPKELFESECLVELSAVGCIISCVDVICSRLESLSLHMVDINDAMLRHIIHNCPWLENLHLHDCYGIDEVNVGRMANIKNLTIIRGPRNIFIRKARTTARRRKTPLIHFDQNGSAVQFSCLTSLLLDSVKIDEMLFCDFFSKFPCVKDLTVKHCDGCDKFDISSPTINSISLAHTERLKIQLNVPNIRKFKFSGADIPTLCVGSASREWKSVIELSCWEKLSFHQLNNFLTSLSTSKITLDIKLMVTEIESLPGNYFKPMVENLTLEVYSFLSVSGDALLDGLCMCLRPKFIKLCLFNANGRRSNIIRILHKQSKELVVLLSKKLMYPIRLQDLEQANVEILEDEEWRPVDWITFLNDVQHIEKDLYVRFCLSWTQN